MAGNKDTSGNNRKSKSTPASSAHDDDGMTPAERLRARRASAPADPAPSASPADAGRSAGPRFGAPPEPAEPPPASPDDIPLTDRKSLARNNSEPFPEDGLPDAPDIGVRINRMMKDAIQYARENLGSAKGDTALDNAIFTMRKQGLGIRDIARQIGGSITEEEVELRIATNLQRYNSMSMTEYRALQIARLEDVINMCYDYARGGDADHIKMLLLAIERLNKMFELETERTKIEIELVTDQQSAMFMTVIDGLLRILLGNEKIMQVLSPVEVNEISATALDAAERQLTMARSQVIDVDLARSTARLREAAPR